MGRNTKICSLILSVIPALSIIVAFCFMICKREGTPAEEEIEGVPEGGEKVGNQVKGTALKKKEKEEVDNRQRAMILYDRIFNYYYNKDYQLFLENVPPKLGDNAFSYLWPFSGMVSVTNALIELTGEEKYKYLLKDVLKGLERYYDPYSNPSGYDSYVVEFGGGQKYYDDNAWIGLEFVRTYRITTESTYLLKARETFEFVISGWDEETRGGILWRENDPTTRNTCSNGPAIVLALELFRETGSDFFYDWALKIYEWTNKNLLSLEGVFWDSVSESGVVDKKTFTYNTGIMIRANTLLYEITKEDQYLEEAKRLAKASLDHFAPLNKEGERFFPDTPWFNLVLLKGYLELNKLDKDPTYISIIKNNIDFAWRNAMGEDGFMSPDWSGKTRVDEEHRWLLDQAAMAELYTLVAIWEINHQEL